MPLIEKKFLPAHFRNYLGIVILVAVALLMVLLIATRLRMRPLDLINYLAATQMVLQRQNPYGKVEFFAPPWLALFLWPLTIFSLETSASFWFIINLACIVGTVLFSLRWLGSRSSWRTIFFSTLIPTLMPAALFCYITGQITPILNLAILVSAWRIASQSGVWLSAFGLLMTTLKPHIFLLPALICLLELIRTRRWRVILVVISGLFLLLALTSIWQMDWLSSLLTAVAGGDYRGGRSGLVSPGYVGLQELGIPIWVFLPLMGYVLWRWQQNGLEPIVFSLSLSANLLIMPYSRSYDLVVLILPLLCLSDPHGRREWIMFITAMIGVFILPFTMFSVITPLILMIGLLLKHTRRGL